MPEATAKPPGNSCKSRNSGPRRTASTASSLSCAPAAVPSVSSSTPKASTLAFSPSKISSRKSSARWRDENAAKEVEPMKLGKRFMVKPHTRLRLGEFDPDDTAGFEKGDKGQAHLEKNIARMDELQYRLYAESRRALLIVLQGMDASGKDGTVRHVMSGLNPQGCRVTSFKVPSAEEARHDFLWRIHQAVPAHGEIGIFNRSHYEDVLVVRVHQLVPKSVWSARYDEINTFETLLGENGVTILKFFLHISKQEQKERLEERLKDPNRNRS